MTPNNTIPSLEDIRDRAKIDAKAAWKAAKAIKWRLRSPAGQYAGLDGLRCVLTDADHAVVFDGRDNEAFKARYYSAVLKVPLELELISCAI